MCAAARGATAAILDQRHENQRHENKEFITVEGATHGFMPASRANRRPGAYANSVKNLFDYAAAWINKRF